MGLKKLFEPGLERFKEVTTFVELDPEEEERLAEEVRSQNEEREKAAAAAKPGSKGAPKPAVTPDLSAGELPEADSTQPNKLKTTPDCASVELGQLQSMSEMLQYFVHADNLEEERRFSMVINDCQVDSPHYTGIVDLAVGLGCQYLVLKGCSKIEKVCKIARFCEIKSEMQ